MCFASSVVAAHKGLFIVASHNDFEKNKKSNINNNNHNTRNSSASSINNSSNNNNNNYNNNNNTVVGAGKLKMSRSKSRLHTEVCGDCGASDPSWASINRGILLCADCCSVHRSLGRHISIIKSLRQGTWEPSVLNFVNSLNAHGANSVWEHHLLDGTNAGSTTKGATRLRKPNAKDPLHPNKSDFIRAKHVNLLFVLKPNFQDDDAVIGGSLEQELSKQLHASVRTSNLETSLRLLVQGADPNYFHEEKRSTPLHVAAKFGQASQIELLIVYGADINAIDGNGLTPLEVARANNHNTIAERLMDVLYDVTDRIIMFLGGKKPDHATGRHLIIPVANSLDISEQLKIARGRLQLVPNKMFEELVMDLYDEVDRRENEAIWATSAINADNVAVPFLPANPFLSATRNQGRQKLARFSRAEFAGLLTDVLIDARRRQNMANLRPIDTNSKGGSAYYSPNTTTSSYNTSNNEHDPNLSDDEPIYDPVASDDDYAHVPAMAQQKSGSTENGHKELNYLRKQINEYVSEINQLKTVVQKLSTENTELKSKVTSGSVPQFMATSSASVYDEPLRIDLIGNETEHELHSMPEGINAVSAASSSSSSANSANNSNQSTIKRPASMYERRLAQAKVNAELAAAVPRTTTSMYQMAAAAAAAANDKQTPFNEEVKHRTDMVTRRLKELFVAMQESTVHRDAPLLPCAERLRLAVLELIAIFTAPTNCSDTIRETLKQLTRYNLHIQHECENLQNSFNTDNQTDIEKYVKELRECVYYIASAVKTILMQFE